MQQMGIAKSMRHTYKAGIRKYFQFCSLYTLDPWPASETTLHYICVHAYRTQSIRMYLLGIRHYHIEDSYGDLLVDSHLLNYLCKGLRRHQGDNPQQRQPVTFSILETLRHQIGGNPSIREPDKQMYLAAMTLAFYGFLRASEFCLPSTHKFSKSRLCRGDVVIAKNCECMSVRIKASKTDQFRRSTSIHVAATHTPTCPVHACYIPVHKANWIPHQLKAHCLP